MNSALWRLRKTLEGPPFALCDLLIRQRNGHVGLRADAPLQVDVENYLQLLLPVLALPLDALDVAAGNRLRDGVALYTGDLLPGAHEDWVLLCTQFPTRGRQKPESARTMIFVLGRARRSGTKSRLFSALTTLVGSRSLGRNTHASMSWPANTYNGE